jgi:predicted dehydrogenase
MNREVRVGIIGYGYAAATFHAPLIRSVPGLELRAISSRNPGKVRAACSEALAVASPEELLALPELDLVVIPTPNGTHYPLACQALEAGRHVVVDKPFTVTLAEAEDLKVRAECADRVLSVFHNRRWDSDFLTLKEVLASGELGRIVHFESHFDRFRPQVRERWREQPGPGSGLWYDLGPHLLDQCLQLFGWPDALHLDRACQRDGAVVDDWFHAVLTYGAMRAILHAGTVAPVPAARFTVHGTRGTYIKEGLDPQEEALKRGDRPMGGGWGHDPLAARVTTWEGERRNDRLLPCCNGDYPAYYAAVRDAILGIHANPVPAEEAVDVMSLLEWAVLSEQEGRTLRPRRGLSRT